MKLVCFVNGIYGTNIGGGDIYFVNLVKNIPIVTFGGVATHTFLEKYSIKSHPIYTDHKVKPIKNNVQLLFNHFGRMLRSIPYLSAISKDDTAYAMSDYWFDVLPLLICKARKKILYLGMIAPFRLSPAGLHYWVSQRLMLWLFKGKGIVTYSHPNMLEYLKGLGYKDVDLHYIPNSFDIETCDSIPTQKRIYDVVWIGRIHAQKGIEVLKILLRELSFIGLKILLIGTAGPEIKEMLDVDDGYITTTGAVSEDEKFRLLKSSKVFIFPSSYESFGIAIGEALISGCQVVAYDLECYRPVYGKHINYIPKEELTSFLFNILCALEYSQSSHYRETLINTLSWTNTRKKFKALL